MCRIYFSSKASKVFSTYFQNSIVMVTYSTKCICTQLWSSITCQWHCRKTYEELVFLKSAALPCCYLVYFALSLRRSEGFFFFYRPYLNGSSCDYHHLHPLIRRHLTRQNQSSDEDRRVHHRAVIILSRKTPNPAEHLGLKHFPDRFVFLKSHTFGDGSLVCPAEKDTGPEGSGWRALELWEWMFSDLFTFCLWCDSL